MSFKTLAVLCKLLTANRVAVVQSCLHGPHDLKANKLCYNELTCYSHTSEQHV